MKSIKLSTSKGLWIGAVITFLLDQLTKLIAFCYLPLDKEIIINKYISLHRVFNEDTILLSYSLPFGMSVEIFRLVWVLQAVLLAIGIYWVTNKPELKDGGWVAEFSKVGLFLILGSIWGNAFDRIFRHDGVIDFIRLNISADTIPIMNIADIMLYMGEINIILGWIVLSLYAISKKISSNKIPKLHQ